MHTGDETAAIHRLANPVPAWTHVGLQERLGSLSVPLWVGWIKAT